MLLLVLLLLVGLLTAIFFIGLLILFILSRTLTNISPLPVTHPEKTKDPDDKKDELIIVTTDCSRVSTPFHNWISVTDEQDETLFVASFTKASADGTVLDWIKEKFEYFGGKVNKVEVPGAVALQTSLGNDRSVNTVLFYFRFNETGGTISKLEADHREMVKDSFLSSLQTVQCALMTGLPLNIKLMVEVSDGMGSINLATFLASDDPIQKKFFRRVNTVCIVDGFDHTPALASGTRGHIFFDLSIRCAKNDLHSGVFGGAVPEAMFDLTWLLAQLGDMSNDNISISVHGIHGAFSDTGDKTVIPGIVTGKISARFKWPLTVQEVEKMINDIVAEKWKKRNSPNVMGLRISLSSEATHLNLDTEACYAAMKSFQKVTDKTPSTTDDSNYPVTKFLNQISNGNTAIVTLGGLGLSRVKNHHLTSGMDQLVVYVEEVAN